MLTLQDIALQCSANLLRILDIQGSAFGHNVNYTVVPCGFPKSLHSVLGKVRSCVCPSYEGIQGDNVDITPLILNLGTRWKWISRSSRFNSRIHTQCPLSVWTMWRRQNFSLSEFEPKVPAARSLLFIPHNITLKMSRFHPSEIVYLFKNTRKY